MKKVSLVAIKQSC